MVTTLRLSSSRSGRRQIHRGRKKRVKFAAMSSPCWWFFSDIQDIVQKGIRTPWSTRQWQVLVWGFEAAEGGHSAQTSRHVEEQQLVSPTWQRARSHITRFSTIPDFQKHYSDSHPHPLFAWPRPLATFTYSPRWNYGWEGVVLTRLRRPTQKHKRLSTHSHLRTSRYEGNHGKRWDRCIHAQGTTSKETVETRSYSKKLFYGQTPRIFG